MKTCSEEKVIRKTPQVISFLTLRRAIGILGLTFPFVLMAGSALCCGCVEVQGSISHYYYTGMRNLFEGIIFAVALFLFTYKGYDSRDDIASTLAGIFAVGLALFPTSVDTEELSSCITELSDLKLTSSIHFGAAALFFVTLSYISLCLFRIKAEPITPRKKIRNRIYTACGLVMLASIIIIALYLAFLKSLFPNLVYLKPVFLFETIALIAFGISWLTKGKAIMDDLEEINPTEQN